MRDWKDRLGIFASAACAVHCAATPVLVATLPTLKFTEWMAAPEFHQVAAVVCCSLVALAILPTVFRFRDLRILTLASSGLGLILTAAFVLPGDCCSLDCCSPDSSVSHLQDDDQAHGHHAHHDHAHHDHAHHDHSHASKPSDEQSNKETPDLLMAGIGTFQPWMTPIGGLLLIMAHVLNLKRRWMAPCIKQNCCAGAESDEAIPQNVIPLTGDCVDGASNLARAS
ncbi:MAG: MerC domain-containing protein [Pirellula sp.]|jgi:hypothetical protein|nr:MerC domain-containing protein [Pirellula sp.]